MLKRCAALTIAILVTFNLTCCGRINPGPNQRDKTKDDKTSIFTINTDNEAYNIIAGEIDKITGSLSSDQKASSLAEEFYKADAETRTIMALDLADDMAMAQFFGIITDDMLIMAGNAVKAYPHPLLLNNFATMLADRGNATDSLFFLLQAAAQDPENPVLLTNIANVYLELDDVDAAERYAKLALAAQSDFGPAYQVLTTVHLKNNDSVLAAETMVKSATHCFNDVTEYHFQSFLNAVEELDPQKDEYPLKEEFIKELYEIASKNVDTKDINSYVDTPGAQIKIKPFPQITSAENLMASYKYLDEEYWKYVQKETEAKLRYYEYEYAVDDYLNDTNWDNSSNEGEYEVKKNVRQIYAFKVLQSYYIFKLEQCKNKYFDLLEAITEEKTESYERIYEKYAAQMEELNKTYENSDGMKWDYSLELYKAEVNHWNEVLNNNKRFATNMISTSQKYYNETKQILEEYWLRAGGLLTYINNEEIFEQFNHEREIAVYYYLPFALDWIKTYATSLIADAQELKVAEMEMEMMQAAIQGMQYSGGEGVEIEQESRSEELVPEIEREAFTEYPESSDMGKIGIEEGIFGFGFSAQYDGESYDLKLDTPVYTLQGTKNTHTGHTMATAMFGVKAEAAYDWLKDSKTIQNKLEKSGKVGRALSAIGKLDLGYTNDTNISEYVVMDSNNRIIDRGILYTREKGYEGLGLGRSEKVVVRKSYMTGIAVKRKTTKYKFMFATYETGAK